KQAMIICDKYKLKTVRGFALALDIVVQNGSINSEATKTIDIAIAKTPNMTEKNLLGVIANAVADSSPNNTEDIRSRKMAIVNGKGIVHGGMLYLDADYGLSDNYWR
ncbi:MAG: SH3 domain-containing protein, partial [Clostridium sp.]